MVRKDYLSTFDDFFDQELIRVFENASTEIYKLYIQAINAGNITKAHSYLSRLKEIQESIKSDFLLWEELRIQEEYLKGAFYASNIQTPDSLLRELKAVDPKNYLARVDKVEGFLTSLGPIHVEAVKALIDESYGYVSIQIDGISKNLLSNLAQIRGIETQMEIAEGVVAGNLQIARDKLMQKFLDQGIASFKDRGGKTRTIERYVDMLVRTETAIANVQGTINRALELGYTKFKVHEQTDCCDICQVYNGNIYDIADGAVELPPYHPHCRGFITIENIGN